jgi:hypothetical protein
MKIVRTLLWVIVAVFGIPPLAMLWCAAVLGWTYTEGQSGGAQGCFILAFLAGLFLVFLISLEDC